MCPRLKPTNQWLSELTLLREVPKILRDFPRQQTSGKQLKNSFLVTICFALETFVQVLTGDAQWTSWLFV